MFIYLSFNADSRRFKTHAIVLHNEISQITKIVHSHQSILSLLVEHPYKLNHEVSLRIFHFLVSRTQNRPVIHIRNRSA